MMLVMDRPGVYRVTSAYELGFADARRHAIAGAFHLPSERKELARRQLCDEVGILDYQRGYADAESLHWRLP